MSQNQSQSPFQIDRKFRIEVRGGVYTGEFPRPKEEAAIAADVGARFHGVDYKTIPAEAYWFMGVCVTLNHVLRRVPADFPEQPPDIDWTECSDDSLTAEVYEAYTKELKEFREGFLKKNREPATNKRATDADQPGLPLSDEAAPGPDGRYPRGKRTG